MSGPGTVLDREPAPPVDPRLRARRIEVRRREGRRRLRRLLVLVAFTVVCAGAWGLSRSPLLDVDHVEVSGIERADPDQVVAASGISAGDALVDLDLPAAEAAIAELGWIESVEVTKAWSGTVHLAVVERRPVSVLVAPDGSDWLVDAQGRVIDIATAPDLDALPVVHGAAVPAPGQLVEPRHRSSVAVAVGLTPGLAAWVDAIVIDGDGELWLDLVAPAGSGFELVDARARLGDARDLAGQLVAVETVLARVDLDCLAHIDARVASSPVVTRHQPCDG